MPSDDFPTRRAYVEHCVDRIRSAFQAIGSEFDSVHEDIPHDLFPSGALFPSPSDEVVSDLEEEFGQTSYLPSAMGFVVRTEKSDELTISLRAALSLYYPVFPTHEEVIRFVTKYGQGNTVKMPPKYIRIQSGFPSTQVTISLGDTDGFQRLPEPSDALGKSLSEARAVALGDPNLYGMGKGEQRRGRAKTYRRGDLVNSDEWGRIIARSTRKAEPHWSGEVLYRIRSDGNAWLVEFMLCNTTAETELPWVLEEAFIGAKLVLESEGNTLSPILLQEVESRDYRYDPRTWASGRNADTQVQIDGNSIQVATDSVPLYVQERIRQQVWHRADGSVIAPTFEKLSGDGALDVLRDLARAMQDYLVEWDSRVSSTPGFGNSTHQVADAKYAFEKEVNRYLTGVNILSETTNKDMLQAFQLTNAAFNERFSHVQALASARAGAAEAQTPPSPAWRLFQIIFLVSEIGDVLHRDPHRGGVKEPEPTVLWFPTGAGKTEAYLGLVVFHAFWDRLRGKPYGVTAIAKFPLRLLSLQQFSRVVAVMEHAEDVRVSSPLLEGRRGDPFSVGYYAGGGNTLNLLDRPVSPDRSEKPSSWTHELERIKSDPHKLDQECLRHRKVYYCPTCITKDGNPGRIRTTFNPSKPGFVHECENCKRNLHLHVTDTEVLRWLPTFVIATIDKLARLATEPWGRTVFGEARVHCAHHGYLIQRPLDEGGAPSGKCPVLGCGGSLDDSLPNVDPVPGLLIQDELHLLTETLGAFASHYETAFVEFLRKKQREGVGRGPWKIIGSTATIEGYRQLVMQLYNRS